ncbi:MAG: DUF1553 domain-containing protein [Limisphaerales bacterium]
MQTASPDSTARARKEAAGILPPDLPFLRGPALAVAAIGILSLLGTHGADFARDVRPVLARECVACHGPDKQQGGLRLDRREDALGGGDSGAPWIPGEAAGSLLIQVVEGRHADIERMPKKKDALPASDLAALRRWIDAGAVWPEGVTIAEAARADTNWWSLQPLRAVGPPSPAGLPPGWDGPMDRFVFAALAAKGLAPSPPAGRRALIRRVTYDVTGLPPAPEEVEAFVDESDPSDRAYQRLVDRLLASPAYGERWGRFWLDVARFGESNGYERNVLWPDAWPFRDYVIRSLNDDKPFDRFILEQLAGDVLAPGQPAAETATAFLVCGPYDDVGNQDPAAAAQIRANHLDDMVRAASEAFLGMTVGCARCHHHKFDPIPTEDYYRMQAAFAGVWHGSRTLATPAERDAREQALKPLQAERERLVQERAALEELILRRAAGAGASTDFALPAPDPYLTEDRFAPVETRAVRLVILANNRDPRASGGARLDEFEVWTDETTPRNAALAGAGGRAEGGVGRVAEDFAGAYGAELVNDGTYGAKWHTPPDARLTIWLPRWERVNRVTFSVDRSRGLPRDHGENVFVGEYRLEVSGDGTNWTAVADSAKRSPVNASFARERTLRRETTAAERGQFSTLARQIAAVDGKIGAVPGLRRVWAGEFRAPPTNMFVLLGGDPQRRGAEITPSSLAFLPAAGRFHLAADAPESERRLAFARWLVSPENPLTPRVLANRVWQSHFGVGLVDTPSDFGWLGGRPSHPELLDWLADRLVAHGWRLKPLHREILLSAAYRQGSAGAPPAVVGEGAVGDARGGRAPLDVDAANRLLWRFPPRRLSGEEIRDSMLAVSGRLDPRSGGPGFRLYRYLEDNVATYWPLDVHGPETYRRAIYHQSPRAARLDLLGDFDCPDNAIAAPSRGMTTSPLQALTLLNHRFTLDMAEALAARVRRESGDNDQAAVRRVFQLTFSRPPTEPETAAALELARAHGWPALCRAQLNANEFLYVD